MKVALKDILGVSTELEYGEPVEQLNRTLESGESSEYQFEQDLRVHIEFYRAELDLFFHGSFRGVAMATCARCLGRFPLELANDFSLVLRPEMPLSGEIELGAGDLSESFYSGTAVDLTPLVYEQVLLALPTRPLCDEECRGLCPQCGTNRNTGQCSCTVETGDPRLTVLRTLKIDRGV